MSHSNAAAEMGQTRNPVGNDSTSKATTMETQNANSNVNVNGIGIGIELQHNYVAPDIAKKSLDIENKAAPITATQRHCDPYSYSVQNNEISSESTAALDTSKTNRRQENTIVQSHPQNDTSVPAATVAANPKTARQRLRKGKWTIEEEEYTSRVIQYFSTGLLTLPDGATLRSYLAGKLNCDPMRITKKFTGACCLGRRAYHLRDRPRASPTEVEMASIELLHLEQRFRLRVEHEQTGLPLPPRHELLAYQPPAAAVIPSVFSLQQGVPSVKATNPWIQNPFIAPSPGQPSLLPGLTGIIPNVTFPGANANLNAPNPSPLLLAAGQLLLQNPSERTQAGDPSSAAAVAPLQMLNNIVASLAFSRALNQQAGISLLQSPGSNASPSSSAAPTIITSNSAPPTSTFKFNAPDITANVHRKSPPIPIPIPVVGSQKQRSEQVQFYKQHEKKNIGSSTVPISKKEEHTNKLKAAFEEQQRALRLAYEKSLQDAQEREEQSFSSDIPAAISDSKGRKPTTSADCKSSNSKRSPDIASPAEQLQRSYEAHLASLQRAEQQASFKKSSKSATSSASVPVPVPVPASRIEVGGNKTGSAKAKEEEKSSQEKTPEEAGTILLGFLNSLRESYENAVEDEGGSKESKQRSTYDSKSKNMPAAIPVTESISTVRIESSTVMTDVSSDSSTRNPARLNGNNHDHSHVSINSRRQTSDPITSLSHFQSSKRKVKPASVTETSSSTSSQPTIDQSSSSQEDSKSDKMGHSSSEESEKEIAASRRISRGPPRKRLKGFHEPHEFTRENLMAHSIRMDMECEESGDASSSD